MRRLRNLYESPSPPNCVRKIATVLLAQKLKRLERRGYGDHMPDHIAEEMAVRSISKPENSFQAENARDAWADAFAVYHHLKDVVRLDMIELERKAKDAAWWW
jgi:hypothetical protein